MAAEHDKGSALERAVCAIETAIISTWPAYRKEHFAIDCNKIVVVDGVRYEIDVWVEIRLPKDTLVVIFECKNWEEKVGKAQVTLLSDTITATNASKGYLVAKSFTADAKARAKKDPRLELLIATEECSPQVPIPGKFHLIEKGRPKARVVFCPKDMDKLVKLDLGTASGTLDGVDTDLSCYVRRFVEELVEERTDRFASSDMPPGVYTIDDIHEVIELDENSLIVEGKLIERITLDVEVEVTVTRPRIATYWAVEKRGRAIAVEITGSTQPVEIRAIFARPD